jgi:two-component system CAI-1 autoinducer sensor kinase/phosphatase CqsS
MKGWPDKQVEEGHTEGIKVFILSMQKLNKIFEDTLEHARPNLNLVGLFSSVGYLIYYFIWTDVFPQPYENLLLRILCAFISIPLFLFRYVPNSLKNFFPFYFFCALFFADPFFFSFMMLKNECSVVWIMSVLTGIFMMTLLLSNWKVIGLMSVGGFIAAYFTVLFLDGRVLFTHFLPEYIPIFLFSIFGGIIFNHKRQLANKTKISLLRSLSGSIAHEMRNPLGSISSAIASVQVTLPKKPDFESETERYDISHSGLISIHNVIEESSKMLNSANKIIDSILTSMQGGEVATKGFLRIRMAAAVDAAISSFPYNDHDEKKFITVTKIRDFDFFGDRDLFFYVLFNLLRNSLYYKDKAGFGIEIIVDATAATNSIRVRDTGPGIRANKRELVFESFYTANKKGGNGLGLSFCRRVVESFGGTISCDSQEGEWTEFTITLPKYDSKKVQEIKNKILCEKQVLIVDDQISNCLILSEYLSELNCHFDMAENGRQALALLSEKRYDLVFMDFEMPLLNGDNAVKLIRSAQDIDPSLALHYFRAPIIGTTALPESEATERARKCGMNEVLLKPVRRADISKIIERYFFSEVKSLKNDREEIVNRKRILMVDDNETSRKFMSMVLKHYGCIVGQSVHGLEAIDALEKEDFDLVLMDVEMPVMDGIEAAKAIRSGTYFNRFGAYKTIPIIALTGNTDEQSIRKIKDAGMNHHLGKPVFKDELLSAIVVMLNNDAYENNENNIMRNTTTYETEQSDPVFWNNFESEPILDNSIICSLQEIGGNDLIASLLETFIADSDKLMDGLADAVSKGDLKQFDQIMHTLKGSSGSVGAHKMYVLSRYLNEFSRKGEWPDNSLWKQILKTVYAETVLGLQNYISIDA